MVGQWTCNWDLGTVLFSCIEKHQFIIHAATRGWHFRTINIQRLLRSHVALWSLHTCITTLSHSVNLNYELLYAYVCNASFPVHLLPSVLTRPQQDVVTDVRIPVPANFFHVSALNVIMLKPCLDCVCEFRLATYRPKRGTVYPQFWTYFTGGNFL